LYLSHWGVHRWLPGRDAALVAFESCDMLGGNTEENMYGHFGFKTVDESVYKDELKHFVMVYGT